MKTTFTPELANERVFTEVKRLCYQGLDFATLYREVLERLRSVVPFEGYVGQTVDPLSGLITGLVANEEIGGKDEKLARLFLEHIYFEDDVNQFGWMARNRLPVSLLSEGTGGRLERAPRYRELTSPRGFGHELRGALVIDRELWGGVCLCREKGRPDFDGHEVALMRRVAPHLGAGLREAVLRSQAPLEPAGDAAAGVLVLDHSGRVAQHTAAAARWLQELDRVVEGPGPKAGWQGEDELPTAVLAVVGALRRALKPETDRDASSVPHLCVRARSGRWLTLQASLTEPLPDRPAETVVVITPAGQKEVVWLHASAYGLSVREKEVVDLVVRGYSSKLISATLYISEYTIRNLLSNVFEKVGVRSRKDLLKRLFLDNLLPDLQK